MEKDMKGEKKMEKIESTFSLTLYRKKRYEKKRGGQGRRTEDALLAGTRTLAFHSGLLQHDLVT